MRQSKRALALLLAAVLCLGLFGFTAFAATKETVKHYGTYTVLGDSIPGGFGLSTYPYSTPDGPAIVDGVVVGLNDGTLVAGSFPEIVSKAIAAEKTNSLSRSGMRSTELRMMLDENYNGDDYTELLVATNIGMDMDAFLASRQTYVDSVKNADLITINIGSNDLMLKTMHNALTNVYSSDSENSITARLKALLAAHGGSIGAAFAEMLSTLETIGKLPQVMTAALSTLAESEIMFRQNWEAILSTIHKLNPDATVLALGLYNPFREIQLSDSASFLQVGRLIDPVIADINFYISALSPQHWNYKFVDISDTEVFGFPALSELSASDDGLYIMMLVGTHPNEAGHAYIADQIFKALPERSASDPTPAPTATPTATPTPTPTPTATAEPTPSATVEPTPAATAEPTATPAPTTQPTAEPTVSPAPAKEFPFKDVAKGSWYYPNVYYVWEKGIMEGISPDTFAPNMTTSRAQFAAVIYRMAGSPDASNMRCPFTDLTADWYKAAVVWCYNNGVVNGTSATTFEPNANITREQMVTMLYRYSKDKVSNTDAVKIFTDAASISEFAVPAVAWAVRNGIVNGIGDGTFAPKGISTRSQLAAVLNRYMELKK